jgi:hypothetical protein
MEARQLWEAIRFDLELGLEHGYSIWKDLDEYNTMVPSRRDIEVIEKKQKFNTPSLKRVLRGLGLLQCHIIIRCPIEEN